VSVFAISAFHYFTNTHILLAHEILRRLYYVPIVIAATRYGVQGGLAVSLLSSVLYLPHILMAWDGWPVFEVGQYGEIVLFNVVGAVTGVMADRLRSERNRYRRTSEELETVCDQLKTSIDERVKAERMATVGRVAAGMAHEIRTPLSAILGCFEICCSDYPPDHPKREFFEILRKEIAKVEGVVAAFLDFAQPAPPSFQPVDLNDLARSAARLVTPIFADRGAGAVDVALCVQPVPISVDAHQIQRALIELLLAASTLAPRGSVKLCTSPRRNSMATVRILMEPVEQRLPEDLFEPFAERRVAYGLMLPLSRRLIENQGGGVKALRRDSRLEFVIELPAPKAAAIETAAVPVSADGS
jgi:signal transduction histidine kinase